MKDAYYFTHDANALDDPKISALISKYGFQGYGWFWAVIELLRQQPEYKYPMNKYTFDTLARRLLCERNTSVEFINDCCHEFADGDSALLCMNDKYIWSESLIKRMKPMDDKREKARQSVAKRWDKYERNTDVIPSLNEPNTSKVNKSKVNKDIYCTFFESIWQLYPNKKGKAQVSDTQKKKLYDIGIEHLTRCIDRYKQTKEHWKEWQHGSTFFNSGYVDYLDENFKPVKLVAGDHYRKDDD